VGNYGPMTCLEGSIGIGIGTAYGVFCYGFSVTITVGSNTSVNLVGTAEYQTWGVTAVFGNYISGPSGYATIDTAKQTISASVSIAGFNPTITVNY
jgi:hypothetical protein